MSGLRLNLKKVLAKLTRRVRFQGQNLNVVVALFSMLLLLVVLTTRNFSASPPPEASPCTTAEVPPPVTKARQRCDKIPPSLAQALIHYSTLNATPQQTFPEISVTARVLEKKSPCNFLVFGLGYDSLMWASLNHGGRTVFLEEDRGWINAVRRKVPSLESHHVVYNTRVSQAEELMESARRAGKECTTVREGSSSSRCVLALKDLPPVVGETEWDLIMVDAPTGYFDEAPGRMGAIYTAGMMARRRREGETHVFVHDVDRTVEDTYSKAFLCEGYLTEQERKLRHFTIPSHRTAAGTPFCPEAGQQSREEYDHSTSNKENKMTVGTSF